MDGEIIGTGGLEFFTDYALLRSVAVNSAQRGRGIGQGIVQELLLMAKLKPVIEVYLLTETAHDFFVKLGFSDVPRDAVPESIKESTEFSSVCPVSAACMVYKIV
jgi:amino-acid N-acetyltransferase